MARRFDELQLSKPVLAALDEMGYETPTPIQGRAIPPLMEGRDVVAQAPTGTGKTCAFGCALVEHTEPGQGTQALVLVPTRELCEQVAKEVDRIANVRGQRVLKVYGGVSYRPQIEGFERGDEIVVGTPGRVMDLMRQRIFDASTVRHLVLDEADRMLDMGFSEDVEWIGARMPRDRHTMLFSATIPHEVEMLADEMCRSPVRLMTEGGRAGKRRDELVIEVGRRNKPWALHRILESERPELAFVFCRTKAMADRLATLLRRHHYKCSALHGDMSQAARERVMQKVRDGKLAVVVATDVLARGIDVRHCDLVVNYDPPEEPEDYIHRVGRTARMGDVGKAITLATRDDARAIVEIEGHAGADLKRADVPDSEGGRDRIQRVHDWTEFADPRGMVTFRIEGLPDEAKRMKVFWDLVKGSRLREDDLGNLRLDDGDAIVEVPEHLASKVQSNVRRRGLLGAEVRITPVRPE